MIVDRLARFDLIHIRKPGASREVIASLLDALPASCYNRLVLHDHYDLVREYHLRGIHLNHRNTTPTWVDPTATGRGCPLWRSVGGTPNEPSISRSCHSLEEVAHYKERCDYVFLSPIYDSISKQGYHSAFTTEDLLQARDERIIDAKVIALGGVSEEKIPEIQILGFGGYAMLGAAWSAM